MERIGVGFILCDRVLGLVFGRGILINDSRFVPVKHVSIGNVYRLGKRGQHRSMYAVF